MIVSLIIAVLVLVHFFFFFSLLKKNYALMDIAWGLGFILIALVSYFHHPLSFKNALILLMVTFWGLRLALYLYFRNRGQPEDSRYAKLRNEWGKTANLQAYFKIFLFQGLLMIVISSPFIWGMSSRLDSFSFIHWIGLSLWIAGFLLEVSSDAYLRWFKRQPENRGQICTTGPWRICRFPNYLGEVSLWYGMYLLCFDIKYAWTLIGPVTLNILILKVTGVPPLEQKYLNRPGYLEYSQKVPRFIPWKL